jgi:hypothetical protein
MFRKLILLSQCKQRRYRRDDAAHRTRPRFNRGKLSLILILLQSFSPSSHSSQTCSFLHQIRVNTVAPGLFRTPLLTKLPEKVVLYTEPLNPSEYETATLNISLAVLHPYLNLLQVQLELASKVPSTALPS